MLITNETTHADILQHLGSLGFRFSTLAEIENDLSVNSVCLKPNFIYGYIAQGGLKRFLTLFKNELSFVQNFELSTSLGYTPYKHFVTCINTNHWRHFGSLYLGKFVYFSIVSFND